MANINGNRMEKAYYSVGGNVFTPVIFLLFPMAMTALLLLTSAHSISWVQGLLATALFCVPWWSYLRWRQQERRSKLSLFTLVAFMYWLTFVVPLFFGCR